MNNAHLFRALPSVDILMKEVALLPGVTASSDRPLGGSIEPVPGSFIFGELEIPRAMLRELVNDFLDQCRELIRQGAVQSHEALAPAALMPRLEAFLRDKGRPHFRRTLNATGVVIHTNLGRSILAQEAAKAVTEACLHYSNLEFDLATGERGSRYSHVEKLLCDLTGAEAALVVNNNAAAVLLMLDTLCKEREVVVSRGQLVEIGGSFRIPEVMKKSGCTLVEVGSTNRCRVSDYEEAVTENTAALLRVHTSNYRIVGFHSAVSLPDLVSLGRQKNLPVLEDLGSGNLCDFSVAGVPILAHDEPTVQKTVADGADVVSFSGDKVLGGPQAGIIVGKAEYISKIKRNHLNRALRIDKMTLAALEATLRIYKEPEQAVKRIPTLRMICAGQDELKTRAARLARRLKKGLGNKAQISVRPGESLVGGGSFPERHLPSTLVYIAATGLPAKELRQRLLSASIPLVARLYEDQLCLDVRTLSDDEFPLVLLALQESIGGS